MPYTGTMARDIDRNIHITGKSLVRLRNWEVCSTLSGRSVIADENKGGPGLCDKFKGRITLFKTVTVDC